MSFKRFDGVSVVTILLLLLVVFSVCAAGGRELTEGNTQKDHYDSASKEGTGVVLRSHPRNLMVNTNDYGRYDPAPAFSRPHFKPIPH